MLNSKNLIDKLIIFFVCLILWVSCADFEANVIILLISMTISGFLSYFEDERLRTVLTLGFSVMACYIPVLTLFLPLIVYDMVFYKYQYINLLGIIPVIYFIGHASVQTVLIVIGMLITCILIRYRTEMLIKLHDKYNKLNDTTREMAVKLKKQNKDLIEKQDTELNMATLNERNRIAREIHDNVGHLLSSSILQSAALLTINRDEKIRDNLKTLNDTLLQAMNNIRNSVHELYDESVDLKMQLEDIINHFTFCELYFDYRINQNPEKKLKYAFISIVKEALSNIIKHSNATHVFITVGEHPAFYQLIIRDNGNVKSSLSEEGLGLKNMTDRIHSLNGNINIKTEKGFEIFISVPKEV